MSVVERSTTWTEVCAFAQLIPERGVAALVGDRQVAVFVLTDGSLFALDNRDPFSGANVVARGIVGDADGEPYVASPVYKHRFSLRTGRCLSDASVSVAVHSVRVTNGRIEVRVT